MAEMFGLTENEVRKTLKMLEASIDMYEKTKKDAAREMRNKLTDTGEKMYTDADIKEHIATIQTAEDDQIAKYQMFGGDIEAYFKKKKGNAIKDKLKSDVSLKSLLSEDVVPAPKININDVKVESVDLKSVVEEARKETKPEQETTVEEKAMSDAIKSMDNGGAYNGETFDIIPLPSNGECYKNKMSKLPVAYLTAYDENMIVSPNLYHDNLIIDYILKAKIKNNEIDPMDMLDGDRDAVILFLRASAYGNEYPVNARDNKTGEQFDATVDLSTIKYKPFNLVGDENGWFPFTLPNSKVEIKFRFLTHRDKLKLDKLDELEKVSLAKDRLKSFVDDMDFYIERDNSMDKNERVKIRQAIREIDRWQDSIDVEKSQLYTHTLTNRMEMSIMSVNGVTDREYIREFIGKMNLKDSVALRKYINENEPGLDYNITVAKPESLGGGSMTVFLQFDQFIFLNIA